MAEPTGLIINLNFQQLIIVLCKTWFDRILEHTFYTLVDFSYEYQQGTTFNETQQ